MTLLSKVDWIATLPGSVRHAIGAEMRPVSFERGEVMFEAGQPPRGVNQVRSGFAKLLGLDDDGRQPLIVIYAPGAVFSETAVISNRAYHHTLTALTPCVIDQLPTAAFWRLYGEHPEIPQALCRKFATVISNQVLVREERARSTVRRLLATAFLDLLESCEDPALGRGVIGIPLSQSEIGDHFHVTRQTVQKEITELKAARYIDKRDGRWIVLDRAGLERLA